MFKRLNSLPAASPGSSSVRFPLSFMSGLCGGLWLTELATGGAGAWAGGVEDLTVPPRRACALAGLPELVRVMPGVIIGGRGTDAEVPFGRL